MDPEDQRISLVLLHDIMQEIKVFIDFYKLKNFHEKRALARRNNLFSPDKGFDARDVERDEEQYCKHILKRFTVISPAMLKNTMNKCETLGLLLN